MIVVSSAAIPDAMHTDASMLIRNRFLIIKFGLSLVLLWGVTTGCALGLIQAARWRAPSQAHAPKNKQLNEKQEMNAARTGVRR